MRPISALFLCLWAPALACLSACGAPVEFEPAGKGAAPDPAVMGPFQVGVRTLTFEDPSRPKEDGQPRTLVTEVWYPAKDSVKDLPRASYLAKDVFIEEVLDMAGNLEVDRVSSEAVRDAELRDDRGPYPLVIFSHGAFATRIQSLFLTVALASHGYVVIAPDHEGNTLKDIGSIDELLQGLVDIGSLSQSLVDRAPDLLFLLRRFEAMDDPLISSVDFDRIGVAGHSFGATTTLRTIALSDRFTTAVAHCPASYLVSWLEMPKELDEVDLPIMVMAGSLDTITPKDPWVDSVWEHVKSGDYVILNRGGHLTFSDLCAFDPRLLALADELGFGRTLDEGCRAQHIPIDLAHALIRRVTIGQFNLHLRGSPESAPFLRDLEPTQEVTLLTK